MISLVDLPGVNWKWCSEIMFLFWQYSVVSFDILFFDKHRYCVVLSRVEGTFSVLLTSLRVST